MKQVFNDKFWLRASIMSPFIGYVFLWILSLLIFLHLKEHPALWFWEIVWYIKNIPWGMTILFASIICFGGLIFAVLWRLFLLFLWILFKILFYPAYIPYLWIARIFKNDKRIPLFEAWECYRTFLQLYYQRNSISGIWKTHGQFIPFMFFREFPKSGIERSLLSCPFELLSKLEVIQGKLSEWKYKELFIKDFEMDDFLITFSLLWGWMDKKDIVNRMKDRFDEIKLKLPWVDDGVEYRLEEPIPKSEHVLVTIKRVIRWELREFDFKEAGQKLLDESLLLGFTPDGGKFVDLQVPVKSFLHSMVVAETGSWKDVTTRSLLWSIVEWIRKWLPYELHLFDSKWDWLPFANLEEYGIFLYRNVDEYDSIIAKQVEDMRRRNETLGIEADLGAYIKSHPDTDMKYRFIFINEFSSLYGLLPDKNTEKSLHSNLNVLFSQSRSAGYRICLMVQTARWSGSSDRTIRQLSLNIWTIISWVVKDEIEAGMISQRFKKHLVNLEKHNFCLIQKGECKEFRSYHSEKTDILKWLSDVFVPDMKKKTGDIKEKEAEETLSELLKNPETGEFLKYSREAGKLSKEEAMEKFHLSETTFRKLASALLTLGEIQSEVGKGYFFLEKKTDGNIASE